MPRKAFVADLAKAVQGVSIAGISDVRAGNDDGEFTFQCVADGTKLEISALITDVSEYPSSHMCMIFAGSSAPEKVADILQDITDAAMGKSVAQILELVSQKLESTDSDGDRQMLDSQGYSDEEFGSDDDDDGEEYFPDDDFLPRPVLASKDPGVSLDSYTKPTSAFRQRIRNDLRKAKAAGFKVGHHGGLLDGLGCYVSLSCRISKLGVSEEAMQAWQIEPTEYLITIFHYPNGYKSMDTIKAYDAPTARRHFGIRVGVSSTYKPTMLEAVRAFTVLNKEDEKRREQSSQNGDSQHKDTPERGFRNSFISRPLNELLEERFTTVLGYRYEGMPWRGAEEYYNDHIGTNHTHMAVKEEYYKSDQASVAYPPIVTADHIMESTTEEHSLPLIGMQFVLRHFVRCTEFCLICFTKMPDDLQAIKPYVCDKPLCLYQYMSLGFGPSIEHEILSQPKVVDLLISFCYTSARLGKLADFPTGLSLMVPTQGAYEKDYTNQQYDSYSAAYNPSTQQPPAASIDPPKAHPMRFNAATKEIIFDKREDKCPLRAGDWIIIRSNDNLSRPLHCRVANTTFYPTIKVSEPVCPALATAEPTQSNYYPPVPPPATLAKPPQAQASPLSDEFRPAAYYAYDQNFDELHDYHKRTAIYALLDALPSVKDMRQYLIRKAQSPLSSWVDRLSPAALGILRWIIASNRACIMQVEDEGEIDSGKKGEERLYGMAGWSQFRFAMGAPDKERKFLQAVRNTTDRLKLKHSTIFAWHGSPIMNWHSIIREGLHFNHTSHGRAYGHGVYHSLDVNTSIGYSGYGPGNHFWPMSELKVSSALALNEVVNAPKEFVSSSPHLVVAQLDWIQTRYLFVKTQAGNAYQSAGVKESKPADFIEQDPNMTPRGSSDAIVIPVHAIAGSRRPQTRTVKPSTAKRRKTLGTGSTAYDPINLDGEDDDCASVCTLDEDRVILEDEPTFEPDPLPTPNSTKGKSKAGSFLSKLVGSKSSSSSVKPLTDYVPGTLDFSTLPMLKAPQWATPAATKRLMKDFQELVKIQDREPAHELGWYIDPEAHDNMYQWIVELHSFDPTLPLAKDMKTHGHKSIVLELRFGNQYPMNPPFVRVIRPKFLGFNQGGGGHVTLGGAMCMQLLTNEGWMPTSSIESVLLQVRMAMSSLDPRPARLESGGRGEYGVGEAIDAYLRACAVHGWTAPAGFREMALGGASNAGGQGFY